MPKLLWFRQDRDEDAIMASLTSLAAQHGYTNSAGPKLGAGNVAELMAAIAAGDLRIEAPLVACAACGVPLGDADEAHSDGDLDYCAGCCPDCNLRGRA